MTDISQNIEDENPHPAEVEDDGLGIRKPGRFDPDDVNEDGQDT